RRRPNSLRIKDHFRSTVRTFIPRRRPVSPLVMPSCRHSNVTTDAYDHLGRLTSVTQPNPSTGASTAGPVTTSAYDSMNRVTSKTNALGYATLYAYDNAGQLISVTAPDPDGAGPLASPVTGYAYDNDGRLT